jgi:hypothetical protein
MNVAPKAGLQISVRQILLLCAVAAITFAWPNWVSGLRVPQGGWDRVLFVTLVQWLPVALPLTILALDGKRQLPWLFAGAVPAVCLLGEIRLELTNRVFNWPETFVMIVLFGGLTIGCFGSAGMACGALLARRWWLAAFWGSFAAGTGFECWWMRWMVLHA